MYLEDSVAGWAKGFKNRDRKPDIHINLYTDKPSSEEQLTLSCKIWKCIIMYLHHWSSIRVCNKAYGR